MLDAFLEERRLGLQKWLILISQHTILSRDELLKKFLTKDLSEFQNDQCEFNDTELATIELSKYENFNEVLVKHEQMRKILNQILTLKRLISQEIKRNLSQKRDYAEMAEMLSAFMETTSDDNLKDFSENFLEISKGTENNTQQHGAIERLELIIEVVIAFIDMCDRLICQRNQIHEKPLKGFSALHLKNIIKNNLSNNHVEEEIERIETQKRRISFGIYCMSEEFSFCMKYLKLLPSILLQFTFDESKNYSHISQILHRIIEIESDKLN